MGCIFSQPIQELNRSIVQRLEQTRVVAENATDNAGKLTGEVAEMFDRVLKARMADVQTSIARIPLQSTEPQFFSVSPMYVVKSQKTLTLQLSGYFPQIGNPRLKAKVSLNGTEGHLTDTLNDKIICVFGVDTLKLSSNEQQAFRIAGKLELIYSNTVRSSDIKNYAFHINVLPASPGPITVIYGVKRNDQEPPNKKPRIEDSSFLLKWGESRVVQRRKGEFIQKIMFQPFDEPAQEFSGQDLNHKYLKIISCRDGGVRLKITNTEDLK